MMFHHAVKASVCAVALVLGCAGSYADTYETIRTGKAGQQSDNFFVKGVGFAQLPYELGTVGTGASHLRSDRGYSHHQETSGLFRKLNVVPEVSVLEINGIGFQRELEAMTVLDAAQAHLDSNIAFAFEDLSSEPARITLSVGDASVASLSAISVDELEPSRDESGEAARSASPVLPADATELQILNSDAAAEADLAAFQENSSGDGSNGVNGDGITVPGLIETSMGAPVEGSDTPLPEAVNAEGGTSSDNGAVASANGSADGDSANDGVDPVLVAELPADLGAEPSIDVELEPISLAAEDGSSNDGSLSDVPVPAAFPLLATVLAGFGVMSVRRSRRSI
jgi:hypothetical protein